MEGLTSKLVSRLRKLGVCTRVEEVRTSDKIEALRAARRLGADLLVLIEAEAWPRYRLSDRTGWYIPNIGLWFLLGLPSWWVPDCIYEVRWAADFRLHSVPSGRRLTDGVRSMRSEKALSVAERGWTWRAFLTPPAYYKGPDEGVALLELADNLLVNEVITLVQNVPLGDEAVSIYIASARGDIASARGNREAESGDFTLPLGITVRSDRELERFAVELDDQRIPELDYNRLTMPEPVRTGESPRGAEVFEYSFVLTERDLALFVRKEEHYVRVLARPRSVETTARLASSESWSTSRTVMLTRPRLGEGLVGYRPSPKR